MKPTVRRWAVLVLLGILAMMLAGCDGGGGESGESPTVPAAPKVTASYGVKSITLSWGAVSGAEYYHVLKHRSGPFGYDIISGDLTGTSYTVTYPVHLTDWSNLGYKVSACNAAGCAESVEITAFDHLKAIGYFKASNGPLTYGNFDGQFGASVALSADGSTMAVGALFEDSDADGIDGSQYGVFDGFNAGAVYIFARTAGVWSQQAYVKASNSDSGDYFGWALALSSDGNTLAVSAVGEDSVATSVNGDGADNSAQDSGAVYIYTRMGAVWSQQAYVKASNTDAGDAFGNSLALSSDGNTLAVGAWQEASAATGIDGDQDDDSASGAGAVYVFTRDAVAWSQQAYVKSSLADDFFFGQSVGLAGDGDTLAAGSNNNPLGAQANGAVSVFTKSGTGWTEQARLIASNNAVNIVGLGSAGTVYYGHGSPLAFSADGDTLVAGAYPERSAATGVNGNQSDTSAENAGAVYVFTRTAGVWSQQAYVKASNTDQGDCFGASIALSASGDILAVGAPYEGSVAAGVNGEEADDSNGFGTGASYVFTRTAGVWSQKAYVKPSNTHKNPHQFFYFGIGVALSSEGDSLAVGAFTEESIATGIGGDQTDVSGGSTGAVYLY